MTDDHIHCHVLEWKYPPISLKILFSRIAEKHHPSFYFQSKDTHQELICFILEKKVLLSNIHCFVNSLPEGVFFVGLCSFDGTESNFFVPKFVVERNGTQIRGKVFMKKNVSSTEAESIFATYIEIFLEESFTNSRTTTELPYCISWEDLFANDQSFKSSTSQKSFDQSQKKNWPNLFAKAHQEITQKKLDKIVIARCRRGSIVNANEENSWIFSKIFHNFFQDTPQTYQVSFCWAKNEAILSISPETLCKVESNRVYTESLAGSCCGDSEEDFLQNFKIQKENNFVANFLHETLAKHCVEIHQSDLHSVYLGYVQHARRIFTSKLAEKNNYWNLIQDLHPTPAVCGTPRKLAKQFIQAQEKFPRKWYAGFGGMFYKDSCDTFVNIRMIYMQNNFLYQYAGVGVTLESTLEGEGNELLQKFRYWPR